jgi:hypothetical protein
MPLLAFLSSTIALLHAFHCLPSPLIIHFITSPPNFLWLSFNLFFFLIWFVSFSYKLIMTSYSLCKLFNILYVGRPSRLILVRYHICINIYIDVSPATFRKKLCTMLCMQLPLNPSLTVVFFLFITWVSTCDNGCCWRWDHSLHSQITSLRGTDSKKKKRKKKNDRTMIQSRWHEQS